jgi:hypothetical protein
VPAAITSAHSTLIQVAISNGGDTF